MSQVQAHVQNPGLVFFRWSIKKVPKDLKKPEEKILEIAEWTNNLLSEAIVKGRIVVSDNVVKHRSDTVFFWQRVTREKLIVESHGKRYVVKIMFTYTMKEFKGDEWFFDEHYTARILSVSEAPEIEPDPLFDEIRFRDYVEVNFDELRSPITPRYLILNP